MHAPEDEFTKNYVQGLLQTSQEEDSFKEDSQMLSGMGGSILKLRPTLK
jgi:hypothetical protein